MDWPGVVALFRWFSHHLLACVFPGELQELPVGNGVQPGNETTSGFKGMHFPIGH